MTLSELLSMQRELQTHIKTQPFTLERIRLAQLAELGEIVRAVKWGIKDTRPAWALWNCDSKPVAERFEVANKLADLLCFVLLEIIALQDGGSFYEVGSVWEDAWVVSLPTKNDYFTNLADCTRWALVHRGNSQVLDFVGLCHTLGFTQDAIETAYEDVYDKNVARWTA